MRTIFGTTEDNVANILMMLVCLITIFAAVFMAVFLMMFFVLMKFASVVALLFLVFFLFDWGRFMAAPGIARIMAYGVQMLVMSMVAGLMFSTLDALKLSDRLQADEAITHSPSYCSSASSSTTRPTSPANRSAACRCCHSTRRAMHWVVWEWPQRQCCRVALGWLLRC